MMHAGRRRAASCVALLAGAAVMVGALPGCVRPPPARVRAADVAPADGSTIDSSLVGSGLTIAVRRLYHPARPIAGAVVVLARGSDPGGSSTRRGVTTDSLGVARLDSLVPGEYLVVAKAVGFYADSATVRLVLSCRAKLEVYLAEMVLAFSGSHEPPPRMPARFTLSTCATEI